VREPDNLPCRRRWLFAPVDALGSLRCGRWPDAEGDGTARLRASASGGGPTGVGAGAGQDGFEGAHLCSHDAPVHREAGLGEQARGAPGEAASGLAI
jgi:hypothetical protein